jgi:hypothetical protein
VQSGKKSRNLASVLKGLLYAERGYYRVIVFVIGGRFVSPSPRSAKEKEVLDWLSQGADSLPEEISKRSFDQKVTALIYEFESKDVKLLAQVVVPGMLTGRAHLERAGLLGLIQSIVSPPK